MISPLKRFTVPIPCLLALLLTAAAPAHGERWYRVELLVFSQNSQTTGGDEQWEATPGLAYPDPLRFLIDPGRIAANLRAHRGRSSIDSYGRQIIDVRTPPEGGTGAAGAAAGAAFTLLPAAELEFRDKAVQMGRSGRYRTLFHEAWRQPVGSKAAAVPIALDRSGDGGQWPQLQGSITLYLSRYLHLKTNLWLNTGGEYFPGEWRMPPPPLAPPSLVVTGLQQQVADSYWVNPAAEGAQSGAAGTAYPYRHAVLLRQSRRMRSNEIHYIDHPLLGLLVKLTPLGPVTSQTTEPEEPEEPEDL